MVGVFSPQSWDRSRYFSQADSCSLAVPPAPCTQRAVVSQAVTGGGGVTDRAIQVCQSKSASFQEGISICL